MSRVILAPNDVLTPFDLRAQNFRVIVEFSTCHRGQNFFSKKCPKVTFRLEKKFWIIFLKQLLSDHWWSKKYQKLFFEPKGSCRKFFSRFHRQRWVSIDSILTKNHHEHLRKIEIKIMSKSGILLKTSRCSKWIISVFP